MANEIAIKRKLSDTIEEYNFKLDGAEKALEAFEQAGRDLSEACNIGGTYSRVNIETGRVYIHQIKESLLKSAWYNLYSHLQIDLIATAKDKKQFEHSMTNPPEFTLENIRASFGPYIQDPYSNIVRGLAEVFCNLDPYYKSHEKMKIGVKGLPKRVVLSSVTDFGWGKDQIRDIANALAAFQGIPLTDHSEIWDILKDGDCMIKSRTVKTHDGKDKTYPARGIWLKRFKNGNGHLFFSPEALRDINKALSDYYGEVLADCYEAKPDKKAASTAVSKDLQYYPTPEDVVARVMADIYRLEGELVLEPSCGCGRFLDAIKAAGGKAVGVEVDPGRAEQCRKKGHKVQTANFLELKANPIYDRVIMNPPFYGKHYAKHVEHAYKFLKPGGRLIAILPATARYDHGLLDGKWNDLPFGSFRDSGTNINTTVLIMDKPK